MGPHATRENIISLAKMAEQEKFDSLWVGERLLWPINPQNPYPGTKDGKFPEEFMSTHCFAMAQSGRIDPTVQALLQNSTFVYK
jgi:alkanesulfonate monooxygenase SsuD/methylene tetrahydromethanopterin reductase-like flavin-dependent oxidoreductase (luciferase family)